jgi:hypothetical protein
MVDGTFCVGEIKFFYDGEVGTEKRKGELEKEENKRKASLRRREEG